MPVSYDDALPSSHNTSVVHMFTSVAQNMFIVHMFTSAVHNMFMFSTENMSATAVVDMFMFFIDMSVFT